MLRARVGLICTVNEVLVFIDCANYCDSDACSATLDIMSYIVYCVCSLFIKMPVCPKL